MKRYSLVATSVVGLLGTVAGRGDSVLPTHSNFERYTAMVDRSPFAVATAVALPAATPDFAKDLYVANAARFPGGDMITLASSADQNFKKYLITGQTVDGFTIKSIEWSDRVGATKVTISKDGNFATLSFNQILLSQRAVPKGPPVPEPVPQSMPPPLSMPAVQVPDPPQGSVPAKVVQRKPGAEPTPTPNPTPASPPVPDPPKLNVKSAEQRQAERMEQQRQRKDDSARNPGPSKPVQSEEVYLNGGRP